LTPHVVETAAATIRYAFTVLTMTEVWAGTALWNQRCVSTLINICLQPIEENDRAAAPDAVAFALFGSCVRVGCKLISKQARRVPGTACRTAPRAAGPADYHGA
jgi:hypothetical protein